MCKRLLEHATSLRFLYLCVSLIAHSSFFVRFSIPLIMLKFNIEFSRYLDFSEIDQWTEKFRELSSETLGVVFCRRPPLNTPLRIQLAAIARGSSDYADGNN